MSDTEHSNIAESAANAVDTAIAEHVAVEASEEALVRADAAAEMAEQATAVAETAGHEAVATVAPAIEEAAATATAAAEGTVAVAVEQQTFEERVSAEIAALRDHLHGHSHEPPAPPEPTAEVVEVEPASSERADSGETSHERSSGKRGHRFGHH